MDQLGIITDIGDIDDGSGESEMDEDAVAKMLKISFTDTAWGHCGGLESRVMRPLTTSRTSGSNLVLI